ncbi:MAG: DUF4149 domain-containing protein [Gemmatimonadales bacterium]|nr:DUF4149 domain-containing protein [Gemmatimonadales bacterium]
MPAGYWVALWLHVLAALTWLGGMLFLGLVGAPVLRTLDAPQRQRLFDALGRRFRTVGWSALALQLATGTMLLRYRGWLGAMGDPAFWRSPTGVALGWKLAVVAAMLLLSAHHDFVLGPAAGRLAAEGQSAAMLRRRAALLARLNAALGLALTWFAIRLPRG